MQMQPLMCVIIDCKLLQAKLAGPSNLNNNKGAMERYQEKPNRQLLSRQASAGRGGLAG